MTIGNFYELEVLREVDFGMYLKSDLGDILIPGKYIPEAIKVGDKIRVFLYRDSEDRLIATTLEPAGIKDEFVSLTVADVNPHGAFMSWGLEKDLFVPKSEQHMPFKRGNRYVVRICLDYKTDRLIGVGKLNAFFEKKVTGLQEKEQVDLLIYGKSDLGFQAVINQKYQGLVYHNEVFSQLSVGDALKGYIKTLREDGKIDLSITPLGVEAIADNKELILNNLSMSNGFLPFHDKSSPEEISETFGMSKKAFKKAIGGLLKEGRIKLSDKGITQSTK
ncbi:GntR family transcriptional regulator [Fulvivirga sp. M361]|nr:GntR family transcriptional regulator [Fulvivirga sp. M361]